MSNPPPIRVLLVDDEPTLLDVLSQYLSLAGFEVITANDGAEALKLVVTTKPHIVVLDIMMPHINGWEACERIKQDPRTCGIPILFLTAVNQAQDHARAKQLCVQGYVTKPCEPAHLVEVIRQILHPTIPNV